MPASVSAYPQEPFPLPYTPCALSLRGKSGLTVHRWTSANESLIYASSVLPSGHSCRAMPRTRNPFVDDEACESSDEETVLISSPCSEQSDRPSQEDEDAYDLHDPFIDDDPVDDASQYTSASPSPPRRRRHRRHTRSPTRLPVHRNHKRLARLSHSVSLSDSNDDASISLLSSDDCDGPMDVDQQRHSDSASSTTSDPASPYLSLHQTPAHIPSNAPVDSDDSTSTSSTLSSSIPSTPVYQDASRKRSRSHRDRLGPNEFTRPSDLPGPKRARKQCSSLTSSTDAPSDGYRLSATRIFITWPQCPLDKHLVGAYIVQKLSTPKNPVTMCVVAQEQHKLNGEFHLHAIVAFKRQKDIYGSRQLDLPYDLGRDHVTEDGVPYHAHIEGVYDYKHCLQYTCKEDSSPYMYNMTMEQVHAMSATNRRTYRKMPDGTLFPINASDITTAILPSIVTRSAAADKPKISDVVAQRLMAGSTIEELTAEYPGYVMQNLQRLSLFQAKIVQPAAASKSRLPWTPERLRSSHMDLACSRSVITWLQTNILQPRRLRQKQLYLYGPPGCGKTSLLMFLRRYLVTYDIPRGEKYYDLVHQGIQLATMDEVTGANKSIQEWNTLLDGSDITLPVKGAQWCKTMEHSNWPIILCSNFAPNHIYRSADSTAVEAFLSRLTVVKIPDNVNLQFHMEEEETPTTTTTAEPVDTSTSAASPTDAPQTVVEDTSTIPSVEKDSVTLRILDAARDLYRTIGRTSAPTAPVDTALQRAAEHYQQLNPDSVTNDNPYILSRYRAGAQYDRAATYTTTTTTSSEMEINQEPVQ